MVSWGAVAIINIYLIAILIEAALRSGRQRRIKNNILLAKPKYCFEFPSRTWALLLVLLFAISTIYGFANMYIQRAEVVYVGPTIEMLEHKSENIVSSTSTKFILKENNQTEALYFSMVTLTTLGYGEFVPAATFTRRLVMWQLFTGVLMLLGIFPLVVARVADF